jgi:hypothetical protein
MMVDARGDSEAGDGEAGVERKRCQEPCPKPLGAPEKAIFVEKVPDTFFSGRS